MFSCTENRELLDSMSEYDHYVWTERKLDACRYSDIIVDPKSVELNIEQRTKAKVVQV